MLLLNENKTWVHPLKVNLFYLFIYLDNINCLNLFS
ncbi:unnamed protein product [Arabidopsis halleri]